MLSYQARGPEPREVEITDKMQSDWKPRGFDIRVVEGLKKDCRFNFQLFVCVGGVCVFVTCKDTH